MQKANTINSAETTSNHRRIDIQTIKTNVKDSTLLWKQILFKG